MSDHPLTRGALLIDQLVQAVIQSGRHPQKRALLDKFAELRTETERYMTDVEIKAGVYHGAAKNRGRRPKANARPAEAR